MHGVEGEVEEPRFGFVVFDERLGLASERVGRVVQFLHRFVAAQNRRRVDITVLTSQKSEKFIKPAPLRVHCRQAAKVPFADQTGGIAAGLEARGEGGFAQRQAVAAGVHVEFVAEALLVAAGHQARAGRRAVGAADVAIGEAHARGGQPVELRGGNVLAALEAGVAVAHVIGDDH